MRKNQSAFVFAVMLGACQSKPETNTDTDTAAPTTSSVPDECDDFPAQVICLDGSAVECDGAGDVVASVECAEAAQVCVEGTGCATCGVSVEVAHVERDESPAFVAVRPPLSAENRDWERYHSRPVTIQTTNPDVVRGAIEWSLSGDGFDLLDDFEGRIDATETATVYVHASAAGSASLAVRHTECPDQSVNVEFRSGPQPPLSSRWRITTPYVERVTSFSARETITTGVNSDRHADRIGLRYDAYLVEAKTPEEWVEDPTLVDVSFGGPHQARLASGGSLENRTNVSTGVPLPLDAYGIGEFDLVLDFDLNGQLDPGDIMLGTDSADFTVMGNLHDPGPLATEQFEHSGGVWYTQRVYYPTDIESMEPAPLVVISHGNGHNYTWYDYLGHHLASYGYVVMAHTNLTQPGIETASTTTLVNTDYFLEVADTLVGGALAGRIDGNRIVWIGHSRGGEGVVRAYDRMVDEGYTNDNYSPEDIVLISSIAPTTFYTVEYSNPHDAPYHLFAGAADGDVHGAPWSTNVQYFRLTSAAESAVQTTYLHGVGHNEFNCCGFDDATGPDLIGRDATQDIAKAYYLALVRYYASGHEPSLDYLKRNADSFRPRELASDAVIANEYRPDPSETVPVDTFQSNPEVDVASSGAAVTYTVDAVTEDWLADGNGSLASASFEPMNGMTQACCAGDTNRGLVFEWYEETANIRWDLADGPQDLREYTWLSVRAAQITRHDITYELNRALFFSISLIDGAGTTATIATNAHGHITHPYRRTGFGDGYGWSNEFSTIRLRLLDFYDAEPALDLTAIDSIQFNFGEPYPLGTPIGRIGIDDVLLEY